MMISIINYDPSVVLKEEYHGALTPIYLNNHLSIFNLPL